MRLFGAVLVVLVAVTMVQAADFGVTKDGSGDRYAALSGNGGAVQFRGAKAPWREDLSFHAFDNAAISAFVAANGGWANPSLNITLNLAPATFAGVTPDGTAGIQVRELISGTDWAYGNGDWNSGDLQWDAGTADATYEYAQTYWTIVDGKRVVDTAKSVPWTASAAAGGRIYTPDAGYVANSGASASGGLREMLMNGPNWTGAEGMVNSAAWTPTSDATGVYVPVTLDKAFLQDMVSNPECRGIILQDANGVAWSNWEVYSKAGGMGAFISITPEPATMALLALGGLMFARRRHA